MPAYGHVNATLPVVAELVQHGHQVIYYNTESFCEPIEQSRAEFRAYPEAAALETGFYSRVNNLVSVTPYLLAQSRRLIPFVLAELEREQPALVVYDALAIWAMQAAYLRQIPAIASITTLVMKESANVLTWRDLLHIVGKALPHLPALIGNRRRLIKQYGPQVFPHNNILPSLGQRNILYTSRLFHPESALIDDSFHFVGPSISAATRPETGFPWAKLDPARPKIYLSLGTIYNQKIDFYRMVMAELADYPAQIIMAVDRHTEPAALGPIPDNFLVQPVVPQIELLPRVDLFVTHGGLNSINEGLYFGVPLVVVPQQIEQAINGRVVARHGAGIVLADKPPYGRTAAAQLRQAINEALINPTYRDKAAAIGQSFHESGGYKAAAAVIETGLERRKERGVGSKQ